MKKSLQETIKRCICYLQNENNKISEREMNFNKQKIKIIDKLGIKYIKKNNSLKLTWYKM